MCTWDRTKYIPPRSPELLIRRMEMNADKLEISSSLEAGVKLFKAASVLFISTSLNPNLSFSYKFLPPLYQLSLVPFFFLYNYFPKFVKIMTEHSFFCLIFIITSYIITSYIITSRPKINNSFISSSILSLSRFTIFSHTCLFLLCRLTYLFLYLQFKSGSK